MTCRGRVKIGKRSRVVGEVKLIGSFVNFCYIAIQPIKFIHASSLFGVLAAVEIHRHS